MNALAQGPDVARTQGLAPDGDIIDETIEIIPRRIVGEADVDVPLLVEIRGRLGAAPPDRPRLYCSPPC